MKGKRLSKDNHSVFNSVINSSAFASFICDKEGNLHYVNNTFCKFTGYQKEELKRKNIRDIIEGESGREFIKSLQSTSGMRNLHCEHKELFFKTKNNSLKPVFIFILTKNLENKSLILAIAIDKTEDKACEILYKSLSEINKLIVTIQEENKLLQSVCNTLVEKAGFSLAAIGTIDKKTKLYNIEFIASKNRRYFDAMKSITISVDPSVKEGKGSVSMAYNTKQIAYIPNVLNDKRMEAWKKYQKELSVYSVCSIPILINDNVEYVLVVYSRILDFFTSSHIDLLEEIRLYLSFALEKIKHKKEILLLNEAIKKSHEWAVITDEKGTILYANDAVCQISGYEKNELMGKTPSIFKSGSHNGRFYSKLWKTIMSGKEYRCRFINRAKNGSLFYLDSIIVPIMHNGEIKRFVDLSRNITKEMLFAKRLECQSNIYNILYNLTNISVTINSKEKYMQTLPSIFTKATNIDISFVVSLDKKGLVLKSHNTKSQTHDELPVTLKNLLNKFYSSPNHYFPALKTLRKGKIYIKNDIVKESFFPFDKLAETYSIGSCCSLPIIQKGKTLAALIIISKQKNLFDKELYGLFNIVAKQIEFILNKIEDNKFHNIVLKALDTGFEFVVITDKNFRIVYANETVQRLSGYKMEELLGRHHSVFASGKHTKEFAKNFYKTLTSGKTFSGVINYKIRNGKTFDFISTIVPYKIEDSIEYYIAVGKRLTKKESLIREMDKILHKDRVTGLLNKNSFMDTIKKLLSKAEKKDRICAIAIINPISFKKINEAFGFRTGDKLLKQIAKRLKANVFEDDTIAKLESDRFGLILKDLSKEDDSLIIASRIFSKLTESYKIKKNTISLSFNIGLSLYPKDASTPRELIDKAQIALADARLKGNNQIGFFRKDLEEKASKMIKLKADLEIATKKREFIAYYQPYVDGNRNIVGAETLIRWKKNNKIIPPMEFIPYLEQTDLIIDVEKGLIDTVLKYINTLKSSEIPPVPLSVNLSANSLNKKSLFEDIVFMLKDTRIEPKYLRFEIIERLFLENFDYLKDLIQRFKEYGISFAVDDFGTGYSSLSYLSKLPVDYLKIDISFVRTIHLKQTKSVVKSIIFLSKELNIKTVAEGIETEEQFNILKDMGCDYFQGFLFYKPLFEDKFTETLSFC